MLIRSLKPNVTRERAVALMKRPMRRLLLGRLKYVMDLYLPYRMFEIRIENRDQQSDLLFAVDAVTGKLDHFRFDQAPGDDQIIEVETARAVTPRLADEETLENLRRKLIRQAFLQGFFKVADLKMDGAAVASLFLPYWIGVYERGGKANLEVIDAVRGRFEGAKLREIVASWFQEDRL